MQLTLELDDQIAARIDAAAKDAGLLREEWIKRLIVRSAADWPDNVKALAGAWRDDEPWPVKEPASLVQDAPREPL